MISLLNLKMSHTIVYISLSCENGVVSYLSLALLFLQLSYILYFCYYTQSSCSLRTEISLFQKFIILFRTIIRHIFWHRFHRHVSAIGVFSNITIVVIWFEAGISIKESFLEIDIAKHINDWFKSNKSINRYVGKIVETCPWSAFYIRINNTYQEIQINGKKTRFYRFF